MISLKLVRSACLLGLSMLFILSLNTECFPIRKSTSSRTREEEPLLITMHEVPNHGNLDYWDRKHKFILQGAVKPKIIVPEEPLGTLYSENLLWLKLYHPLKVSSLPCLRICQVAATKLIHQLMQWHMPVPRVKVVHRTEFPLDSQCKSGHQGCPAWFSPSSCRDWGGSWHPPPALSCWRRPLREVAPTCWVHWLHSCSLALWASLFQQTGIQLTCYWMCHCYLEEQRKMEGHICVLHRGLSPGLPSAPPFRSL